MQVQPTYISGEGRSITEVSDVVTLWKDLRADVQVKIDAISKRTSLEVSGCGRSVTGYKEYFSVFTVTSSRQGDHYLVKTNYKTNSSGELQAYNGHTYNVIHYTYENQKLEMQIEMYNDLQGLVTGHLTLEPQGKKTVSCGYHI